MMFKTDLPDFDGYYQDTQVRRTALPDTKIDEGTIPEIIDLLGGIVFTGEGM